MKEFDVEANIYSMNFWGIDSGFFTEEAVFVPFKNHSKIEKQISDEREHHPTGIVRVRVSATDCDEAIEKSSNLLTNYSSLLTFAEGHDVFFREYTCFEIENGKRAKKSTIIHSMRFGKAVGSGVVNSWKIEQFIKTALPLVRNETYSEKTGIKLALLWSNEALNFNFIEIKFSALWFALEVLANSHARANPKTFLLSNEEWSQLMTKFEDLLEALKVSRNAKPRLFGALGFARQGSIEDTIKYLLESYAFSQYSPEVRSFNEMRNTIFHGRPLSSLRIDPYDTMKKLERLIIKLILSILKFYKEEFVHPVLLRDDLLAKE
jgi:hypothetical protein